MKKQIYEQITKKKEFSQLPKKDVEIAFSHFSKRQVSEDEKIRLTRELLHKVFGAFTSTKLLSPKDKDPKWILRKHLSTRERLIYYEKLYKRLFRGFNNENSVIDLGAGVNGFSYNYLPKGVNYVAVEAIGQLVDLMNNYFKTKITKGNAFHFSLFELEKVKNIIAQQKRSRVVFLFKTLDSLEMLKRDYSKELLNEIVPLTDKIVVSFATKSMISRKSFKVNRNWIIKFIEENFEVLDNFEWGDEKYIVFKGELSQMK
ncbi:MAG: hypothetical protein ABIB79_02755 [archaeon]